MNYEFDYLIEPQDSFNYYFTKNLRIECTVKHDFLMWTAYDEADKEFDASEFAGHIEERAWQEKINAECATEDYWKYDYPLEKEGI